MARSAMPQLASAQSSEALPKMRTFIRGPALVVTAGWVRGGLSPFPGSNLGAQHRADGAEQGDDAAEVAGELLAPRAAAEQQGGVAEGLLRVEVVALAQVRRDLGAREDV